MRRVLGNPDVESEVTQPIPDSGVTQGVQAILQGKYAEYRGSVKSYLWKKESRNYQAFLIMLDGKWTIIGALSWERGASL